MTVLGPNNSLEPKLSLKFTPLLFRCRLTFFESPLPLGLYKNLFHLGSYSSPEFHLLRSPMSNSPKFGSTLSSGIQDVSALLPIFGTEQCEEHVGSALEGGFVYAAATPLSIFGSLGIVKSGLAVFFSSISIPIPFQSHFLGAKMYDNAGFKISGTVAPLIGMDGQRFKAETRFLEILKEKHIDDPTKIQIEWQNRQWNTMLVLTTILCSVLSFAPYIVLNRCPSSLRPLIRLPWLYPSFRIVGSCFATIACQFIIQFREVSIIKSRVLFMHISQEVLHDDEAEMKARLQENGVKWDPNLPAEYCIWSLEKFLLSQEAEAEAKEEHRANSKSAEHSGHVAVSFANGIPSLIHDLNRLRKIHFQTSILYIVLCWIGLGLSLPAILVGYVGCFTLVNSIPSGDGPLIWLGIEAALSIFRLLLWAINPRSDEKTQISVTLALSKQPPMVTSDDYNPHIIDLNHKDKKPYTLVPEREFLEQITPFTGPLDRCKVADNIKLYFTLTSDYGKGDEVAATEHQCLFMTVINTDTRVGVTFVPRPSTPTEFYYFDVSVSHNIISRRLEATIQSDGKNNHPWGVQDNHIFESLEYFYKGIIRALNRKASVKSESLSWKWDLLSQSELGKNLAVKLEEDEAQNKMLFSLTNIDQSYLLRGYEHQLKIQLIAIWSRWIVTDMQKIRLHSRNVCREALNNANGEEAKKELTELDAHLAWEWAMREVVLFTLSRQLENFLYSRMTGCIFQAVPAGDDPRTMARMRSEFNIGQRKRMVQERGEAKKRMEKAMNDASEQADSEGRPWRKDQPLQPQWTKLITFIDQQWSSDIERLLRVEFKPLKTRESKNLLNEMARVIGKQQREEALDRTDVFMDQLLTEVSRMQWRSQHKFEVEMMQATVEGLRPTLLGGQLPNEIQPTNNGQPTDKSQSSDNGHFANNDQPVSPPTTVPTNNSQHTDKGKSKKELWKAYNYPEPDIYATAKFVPLRHSLSDGRACSAMVYDASSCDEVAVLSIVKKTSTHSVVGVKPKILSSIPENQHLLFLSCCPGDELVEEPKFVQQNRERWWKNAEEGKINSWISYFTPQRVVEGGSCFVASGCIAHILVSLAAPSTIRVRLLHCGRNVKNVYIQENGQDLGRIDAPYIQTTFGIHDFEGFKLERGRHDLELIAYVEDQEDDFYLLRDIVIGL